MTNLSDNNSYSHWKNLNDMAALNSNLNPNAKEFIPSIKWKNSSKDCSLENEVNEIAMQMEKGELPKSELKATSEASGHYMPDSKSKQNIKETSNSQHSAQLWEDLLDEFNGKGKQLYMINVNVGYQSKNVVVKLISKTKKQLPESQKALEEIIQIDLSASSTLELKAENLLAAKLFHGISNLINEKIVESAEYSGCSEYSEDEIAHQIEHIKMLETVFSQGRETSTDESIVQCALGELCKELGIPEKEIDEMSDESIENLSNEENNLVRYYDNEIHTSDNSYKSSEENNGSKLFKYQSSDGCELHVNQMSDCEDKMDCFETYLLEAPPSTPALSRTDVSIRVFNDAMNMKPKVSKSSTLSGAIRKTYQAVLGSTFKRNFTTETVTGCRCTAGANRLCGGGGVVIDSNSLDPHKIAETKKGVSARHAKHIPTRSLKSKATLTVENNLKKMTNRSGTCKESTVKNLNDKNTHNICSKSTKAKRASLKNSVRGSGTSSGCRQNEARKAQAIWKL